MRSVILLEHRTYSATDPGRCQAPRGYASAAAPGALAIRSEAARARRRVAKWFGVLATFLVACGPGGDAPPVDTQTVVVEGTITLPAGFALAPQDLTIATPTGIRPIAANGRFRFAVEGRAPLSLDVLAPDGRLIMLGLARDGQADISPASTARGLLYLALGGSALPPEHAATLDTLLADHPATATLAATLTARLLEDPYTVATDETLVEDLQAARDAALADTPPALRYAPLAVSPTDVVLEPGGGVLQSGVAVLQNPDGRGLVIQNHFRRPVELLAYQVAAEDANQTRVDTSPPKLVGEVRASATQKLELFTALGDVLVGAAPWSPVLSEPFGLPLADGRRTYYELVVLGPTFDAVTRPRLFDDLRFVGEREAWTSRIHALGLDMFLTELALPLLESYVFGRTAVLANAKRAGFVATFKRLNDTRLAQIGVYLQSRSGLAQAMHLVLDDLAAGGGGYRLDFMDAVKEALSESERNKLDFDAVDKRLAARASAATVLAAVQIALTSGDVAAILKDLQSALTAESWQATTTPPFITISPDSTIVHEASSQQIFKAKVRGDQTGQWRYRWSTSGRYGYLSDYLQRGTTLDTDKDEVFYQIENPRAIGDDLRDTVTVEVFPKDTPGGSAVGRAVATVEGRDWTLDSRLFLEQCSGIQGMWRPGPGNCAFMSLRFQKTPSATSYTISMQGDLGAGDADHNNNTPLARGFGSWSQTFQVPRDLHPYPGECWCGPDDGHVAGFILSEVGNELWLTIYQGVEHPQFLFGSEDPNPNLLTLAGKIALWYDWLDDAKIEVQKNP